MTKSIATRFGIALLLFAFVRSGSAEDIDIFGQAGVIDAAPTIIFVLDNSANWARASQQWPEPSETQGEAELLAIATVLANLEKPLNVGLVMLTNRNEWGGYVRFGVRPMLLPDDDDVLQPTDANARLRTMLTEISSKVNDPSERVPQAQDGYANALYETWLYLQGVNSWAGMDPKADFAGNITDNTTARLGLDSGWAYAGSADKSRYNPPIADGSCGSTNIVFIGNNREGTMPYVPSPPRNRNQPMPPAIEVLQQYDYTTPAASTLQATWARFLRNRPDLGAGTPAAAAGAVVTYAIDAYNAQQNPTFTTMMRDMAQVGGGKYFKANSDDELVANLEFIVSEVQAKNSVFAAVSLPVSVNQRGTFLNQVYLGVFRPDRLGAPNWPGNLKLYQIAVNTNTDPPTLFLADKDEVPAASAITGFISPGVTSFWTTPSPFWATNYFGNSQGVGGPSDAPDGDLVEKGGVAQRLRIAYPLNQDARKVYTCTGACAGGSLLSSTQFKAVGLDANDDVLAGDPDRVAIINWVRGANNMGDENPLPSPAVRGFLHGDVLHSRPAVVNYGGAPGEEVVYVYYGSNDGMLHAVRGGPNVADGGGTEEWAFIAPEHFDQFSRMRLHAPPISPAARKPYFIDGSATAYTKDVNRDGVIDVDDGDKAYLFLTMRRGGRYIYALDITDPTAPRMLWKRTSASAGFEEMAQTWSDLNVATIRASEDPVLIFGLGYDPLGNDSVVPGVITSGRGVIVLNALTGNKIWASSDAVGRNGIDHSVAATVAPVDTDGDGLVDRIIAADTGANIWRINIDDADPADWTIAKVASLGTGAGAGARRFINGPDVVLAGQGDPQWDSILIGSGDREQPFDVTVANRFYMIKDRQAKNYVWPAPLTEVDLYDATANLVQDGTAAEQSAARVALAGTQGWYIRLNEGEKVVGPSTTLGGTTFFGTNTPLSDDDAACGDPGTARNYAVSFKDATATIRRDGILDAADRSAIIPGGGLPPAPVALQVEIDGQIYQAVAFGTQILQPPGTAFGRRFRSWWYQPIDR